MKFLVDNQLPVTAMESAFEDASVAGYEILVASMTNDPKDRHVLAVAIRRGAHAIVTANVRRFPPESVNPHDLDRFLLVIEYHREEDGRWLAAKEQATAAIQALALPLIARPPARTARWCPAPWT
ncbi:MAG: hypothetical protein JJE04_10795 [Acidobacteriia bacterium]|nr:hypothetical protein [Terriglobia bacterium]